MSAFRSDLCAVGVRTAVKAVSLATGFAAATLIHGMVVSHVFMLTFIIVAAAVRVALGVAIERPSLITRRLRHG